MHKMAALRPFWFRLAQDFWPLLELEAVPLIVWSSLLQLTFWLEFRGLLCHRLLVVPGRFADQAAWASDQLCQLLVLPMPPPTRLLYPFDPYSTNLCSRNNRRRHIRWEPIMEHLLHHHSRKSFFLGFGVDRVRKISRFHSHRHLGLTG